MSSYIESILEFIPAILVCNIVISGISLLSKSVSILTISSLIADISGISKNKVEQEVLFDRNKSFKILSARKDELNAYHITLNEI